MNQINPSEALDQAIILLKQKQELELLDLKNQYHETYSHYKPINILKRTFGEVRQSSEVKNDILSSVIGLVTGYATRKAVVGSTHNPIKKVFGTLLQMAVTAFVQKKAANYNEQRSNENV